MENTIYDLNINGIYSPLKIATPKIRFYKNSIISKID